MRSFLFLICATFAFGAQATNLPQEVKYLDLNDKHPTNFDGALDKAFENLGYKTSVMDGVQGKGLIMFWLNRIYSSPSRGMVFAKAGIQVGPYVEYGKVYQLLPGTFVSHLNSAKQGDYVLYFYQTNEAWAKTLTDAAAVALKSTSKPATAWDFSILPAAYAEGAPNHFCEDPTPSSTIMDRALAVARGGASCVKDIAIGVWQATGGLVVAGLKAIWSPYDTIAGLVNEVSSLGNFFANFEESFGEMKQQIRNIPPEVMGQIACELVGNIGAAAAITFFTAGGGGPVLTSAISRAVTKVAEKAGNSPLRTSLESVGKKMAEKADTASKIRAAKRSEEAYAEAEKAYEAANDKYMAAHELLTKPHEEMTALRNATKSIRFKDRMEALEGTMEYWKQWTKLKTSSDSKYFLQSLRSTSEFMMRDFAVDQETKLALEKVIAETEELAAEPWKFHPEEVQVRGKRMREELEYWIRQAKQGRHELKPPSGGWVAEGAYEAYKAEKYDPLKAQMELAFDEVKKTGNVLRGTEESAFGKTEARIAAATVGIATCETLTKVRAQPPVQSTPASHSTH